MQKLVIYIHGKGGNATEAEHFKTLFPDYDIVGFDYISQNPWDASDEFADFFNQHSKDYKSVTLIANSVGAYWALLSLADKCFEKVFLISPIVNMETLIKDMMSAAGISEKTLKDRQEIIIDSGEILSWKYLCYVQQHPIKWHIPAYILYGENDNLTSIATLTAFAEQTGSQITVMKNGEHWFHTDEQMKFLDNWILTSL